MTNAIQIATVAVVLVSDRFLVSHAFLKDSAVRIRACTLTAAGNEIRSSMDAALRQAGLGAGDVQLVESQGPAQPPQNDGLPRNTKPKQTSRALEPLKDFSTTGLAGLCGIGENPRGKCTEESHADAFSHSLATARLDT